MDKAVYKELEIDPTKHYWGNYSCWAGESGRQQAIGYANTLVNAVIRLIKEHKGGISNMFIIKIHEQCALFMDNHKKIPGNSGIQDREGYYGFIDFANKVCRKAGVPEFFD